MFQGKINLMIGAIPHCDNAFVMHLDTKVKTSTIVVSDQISYNSVCLRKYLMLMLKKVSEFHEKKIALLNQINDLKQSLKEQWITLINIYFN